MNVLDIAQNSVAAGAKNIRIELEQNLQTRRQTLTVEDDGCGMDARMVKQVTDPFTTTRTTRKVGLGLPFLKMAAEMAGGDFSIESRPNVGTKVQASFYMDNIDLAPLGDMPATIAALVQGSPDIDFLYTFTVHSKEGQTQSFTLNTKEVRQILGEVSLAEAAVTVFLKEHVAEGMLEVQNPPQAQAGQ